jgi:hypothetical protein
MSEDMGCQRYLYVPIGLVFALLVFGLYRHYRPDPLLRKARELQQALARGNTDLSQQERQEKRQQLRDTMRAMTPRQRQQMASDGRKRFEEQMLQYARKSPQDKTRYLDEQIDRMEQFRRNSPQNSSFGSGQSNLSNRSAEDRERRRRERLDQTTPEFRAAMDQFRHDLEMRRQQRGLATGGGGRR